MAKQFSVNLVFNANTQQAKKAVKDLQGSLDKINSSFTTKAAKSLPISKELREANDAAIKLKAALQSAMNPETGTLQLDKFNTALKTTGLTVDSVKSKLMSAGQTGTQAWVNMTNAVIRAEKPIKQTNVMLDKMWTTMKNTMRWQLSASVLQGLTGAISTAFNYAKDLNESLNNIRIVTGKGVSEMKNFAEQANRAAKALSTTTTAYTNAALIYYQQGLNNEEVLERTNATIKLANAVGESAKTVSEWMTAVWNNFDDGSKSLEYYADVMAALGAATASSADEIAQGLEKFAAIADTVGLSYEYATAALTTVTAQTRQSADVVGTAFKTMFARMQDLELGKTLEDGTTLGQYAATLDKVGVKVLDASGDLRAMDAVLNDLGNRWKDLSSAEQVAVAQGVAGIRQYSQMIALMDNWDSFQTNLMTAQTAEGALSEQADIYAESWEAASKRVKASAEQIYQSLLNDEFFIDLNNGLADTLELLDKLLDSMGGMPGLLALIGAGLTKFLGPHLVGGIISLGDSIKKMGSSAEVAAAQMRLEVLQVGAQGKDKANLSRGQQAAIEGSENILGIQTKVDDLSQAGVLSEKDNITIQTQINTLEELNQEYLKLAENVDKAKKEIDDYEDAVKTAKDDIERAEQTIASADADIDEVNKFKEKASKKAPTSYKEYEANKQKLSELKKVKSTPESQAEIERLEKQQEQLKKRVTTIRELAEAENKATEASKRKVEAEQDKSEAIARQTGLQEQSKNARENLTQAEKEADIAQKHVAETTKQYGNELDKLTAKAKRAQQFTKLAQGLSSLAFGLSSLSASWDTLTNEDMSWWDKLLSITMSLSMALPMLVSGFKALKAAKLGELIITGLNTLATKKETKAKIQNAQASDLQEKESKELTGQKATEGIVTKLKGGAKKTGKTIAHPVQSLKSAGLTSGGALAGIGILASVALIAGGIALAKQFDKEYNKVDKAFEKAKKHTQAMREEYNRTAEASRALEESINKYSENHKNLNAMVKGTMEYRQALLEANEQALELIKNNKTITSADYKIIDGQIVIDDAALERAQEEALNKQLNAQSMVMQASIDQNAAAARKNRQDAARRIHVDESGENWKQAGQGAASGGMVGAGAGLVTGIVLAALGPIGWAIGGIVAAVSLIGGIVKEVKKDDESKAEKKAISALEKAYEDDPDLFGNKENVKAVLKQADLTDKQINALLKNTDALQEVVESNRQLALQTRMYYEQLASNILSQSYKSYGIREEDWGAYTGALGKALADQDKKYKSQEKTFVKELNDNDKQIDSALTAMYDANVTVGAYNGAGLKGNQVKIKNKDGSERIITQTQAAEEIADYLKNMVRTDGYDVALNWAKQIAGSGNDGFLAMFKRYLDEGFRNDLQSSIDQTKTRDTQLKGINAALGTITDPVLSIEARNALNTAIAEEEQANLAAAGLTYQNLDELQDYLYRNWDSLDEVNVALEQAIREYNQDKREVVADANDAFDLSDETTADLQEALSWVEMSGQEFNAYADAVVKATGATKEFGNAIAESIIRHEKGATKALTTYLENMELFKEADLMDVDYSKKIAELEGTLETWFDAELDSDFVRGLASSDLFDRMLQGGEVSQGALNELQRKVADAMLYAMDVDDETGALLQDKVSAIFEKTWKTGETLSEEQLAKINKLWTSSNKEDKAKVQEVIDMLEAYGFEVGEVTEGQEIVAEKVKYVGTEHVKFDKILDDVNENLEIEIDRYHELEEALNDLSEATNYYKKVRDSLYNEDDSWWNKELKAAQQNIKYLEKYKNDAKEFIQFDYDNMIKASANIIGTPKLDSQGRITNYVKLQQANVNNDNWKEFQELMDKYETSLNTYEAKSYELAEAKLEYLDQSIAKVTEETKKLTTLTADSMKTLEFQFKHLGDSGDDTIDRIQNLSDQIKSTLANKKYYEQGLKDYFLNYSQMVKQKDGSYKEQKIFNESDYEKLLAGDLDFLKNQPITEDFVNDLRSMRDGLMDTYNSLDGFKEKIQEEIISGYEKWNEKFEDNSKALEHNMKVLKGYRNIIDLLGKDMLGIDDTILAQASTAAVNIATTQMDNAKKQFDFAKSALDRAKLNPELFDDEAMKKLEDSYHEAELGLTETLAASVEAINAEFDNSLNAIMDNFDKKVGGIFGSLSEVQEWFDRVEELEDFYLKPYEKTYEINTLNREIQDAIQNSDNLKYQRELNELSSELLGYQEEGVEMSDQDLEYMQKRFEVMKAQAAFEEAQNAKREVRLTRDSQGNYSYIYTANEEATNKAQADLDKALYDLDKYFDDTQSKMSSTYLQITKEYADAVAALDKTSTTYKEDLKNLTDFYTARLTQVEGEMSETLQRAALVNENYGTQAKTQFNELVIGQMYTDVNTFSGLHEKVTGLMEDNITTISNEHTKWGANVNAVFTKAGMDVETFGKTYANVIKNDKKTGIEDITNGLATSLEGLSDSAKTGFEGIVNVAATQFTKFDEQIKAYKTVLDGLLPTLNEFLEKVGLAKDAQVSGVGDILDALDGNPVNAYDWEVIDYVDQVANGDGVLQQGVKGIKVKNTQSGEEKIVDASKIDAFSKITDKSSYDKTSIAGKFYDSATDKTGQAITDATGYKVYKNETKDKNNTNTFGTMISTRDPLTGAVWVKTSNGDVSLFNSQELLTADGQTIRSGPYGTQENTEVQLNTNISDTEYKSRYQIIDEKMLDGIPYYQIIKNPGDSGIYVASNELEGNSLYYSLGQIVQLKANSSFNSSNRKTLKSAIYDILNNKLKQMDYSNLNESQKSIRGYKKNGEYNYDFYDHHGLLTDTYTVNIDKDIVQLSSASIVGVQKNKKGQELFKLDNLYNTGWIYDADNNKQTVGTAYLNDTDLAQLIGLASLKETFEYLSFDTGGYTGSWGPEGRMAMLHQKEIVLNAHDTENFLTAVQIVRSMADKLELSARAAQQGLGALVHASTIPGEKGSLEQTVTIHAEFPNATNHSEIEEAFRNLTNMAAQYAAIRR